MIFGILDQRVNLYRRTSFVVDAASATASLTVARQPVTESVIAVRVSGGTSNTGTVTVSGVVSGSATFETLTFSGASVKQTVKRYASISSITTSGLSNEATVPTISVEARSPGGEQQFATALIVTSYPAAFSKRGTRWTGAIHGVEAVGRAVLLLPYAEGWEPLPNDVVRDLATGDEFLVRDVDRLASGRVCRISHWEVGLERRDNSTT